MLLGSRSKTSPRHRPSWVDGTKVRYERQTGLLPRIPATEICISLSFAFPNYTTLSVVPVMRSHISRPSFRSEVAIAAWPFEEGSHLPYPALPKLTSLDRNAPCSNARSLCSQRKAEGPWIGEPFPRFRLTKVRCPTSGGPNQLAVRGVTQEDRDARDCTMECARDITRGGDPRVIPAGCCANQVAD